MNRLRFPKTRQAWDLALLLVLPLLALAAAVGHWFGGPLDNLVVVCWLLPFWLLARTKSPLHGNSPNFAAD
jgi:hypothetical protein